MSDLDTWSARLVDDGFLERGVDGRLATTRRWHAALARAALQLYKQGSDLQDMRAPIASVLLDHYGEDDAAALADGVRAMLLVAMRELVTLAPKPA